MFYKLHGSQAPLSPTGIQVPQLFMELGLCALLYFALNTMAVATAVGLTTRRNTLEVWRKDFLWLSLPNFAGASVAAIIFIYFEQTPFFAVAVAAPVVLVIYYAYKLNLQRINQAQQHVVQLNDLYHSTIESLAMAIDAKDAKTHGHIQRVQTLALRLADHFGVKDENELEGLRAASLLHDIGKLAIPEYILNKPSPLTKWEEEKVRKHPNIGADILNSVPFPYPVIPFVRYHHERWDGTGYPDGLSGEEIPLGARILSIADCYDALRSERPYRPQLTKEVAVEHIKSESGRSYDPKIVRTLEQHVDDLELAMKAAENELAVTTAETHRELEMTYEGQEVKAIGSTVFHEIASTHKEIQALYEISRALGRSLRVSDTLSILAEKIYKLVPYSSCVVYLVDSQKGTLDPYYASGLHSELLENLQLGVGEGVTGWVAAHKQHLVNVSPAPDFMGSEILHTAYRTCLLMPLTLSQSIVGVISLYSARSQAYNQDHLRFMETIADHAATAIRNAIIYEETQEDAYTDILTGLPNLRYFNVYMEQELKRTRRLEQNITLLMMDLEYFKEVNDRFGHKTGNRILLEIAHVVRDQLRNTDICVRYAGDEFIAIMPGTTKKQARHAMQRIQKTLDNYKIWIDERNSVQVGISIGASTFPDDGRDPDLLLAVADQAMYRNKFSRRRPRRGTGNVVHFKTSTEKPS